MDSTKSSRKTIGIIIDHIEGIFDIPFWKGVQTCAREMDFNLLVFSGNALRSQGTDVLQPNIIYQIVNTHKLDGLILETFVLSIYNWKEEFQHYVETYKNIPIVSTFKAIPGINSVIFDNKAGMRNVIEHLIHHHHYRKIAYFSGPETNYAANLRRIAYEEVLTENHIPIDPDLIIYGNFKEASGAKAVDLLFNERGIRPEAIVAANDQMAIGAYKRLKEMNIEIGKEIALTGFDDIEDVRILPCPFTSVHQPAFEMARKAAALLCNLIDGKSVPFSVLVEGELVVRKSCGCDLINPMAKIGGKYFTSREDIFTQSNLDELGKDLNHLQEHFIQRILQLYALNESEHISLEGFLRRMFQSLVRDIENGNAEGEFINTVDSIISIDFYPAKFQWSNILTFMRSFILSITKNHERHSLIENIFYLAQILIGDILCRRESSLRFNNQQMFFESSLFIENINTCFTLEAMLEVLKKPQHRSMRYFGINQFYLCLYEAPLEHLPAEDFRVPENVRLVMGFKEQGPLPVQNFKTNEMLPNHLLFTEDRNELMFMPLTNGQLHFGYVVFDLNPVDETIYETICEHISNSLKSQMFYSERKKAEEQLEIAFKELENYNKVLRDLSIKDELTGLYNRRGFYLNAEDHYKSALAKNKKFILFFADLDGLKKINDNYGHKEGDEALIITARILEQTFRGADIIARLGGDEYTILALGINEIQCVKVKKRLQHKIDNYNKNSNKPYTVSISLGISSYSPDTNYSFDELMKDADNKLYEAKRLKKRQH